MTMTLQSLAKDQPLLSVQGLSKSYGTRIGCADYQL